MYLGIDLGTTGVKVVLINQEQLLVDTFTEPLTVSRPHPLWSEQDPHQWWTATQTAVDHLQKRHTHAFSAIRAIGLSGQMHGATLLDKHDQVLRPAILWNDGRSGDQCAELIRVTRATEITGNLVMPGFTAPKLLWVKQHEPDVFKDVAKVLLPKDFIRLQLSGHYATDMSDASGTMWLNVAKRQWSNDMLAATGLNQQHMPELFEGNEITGILKPELAKRWGMSLDTKIVAGAGDNAASAMSTNTIAAGDAFLSLGTSGVYFVASNKYQSNPEQVVHSFCHCLPNRWHQMTVHLSAAICLDWATKALNFTDVGALLHAASTKGKTNSLFLPYLSGERTPHNNPYARSVFFGMDHDTDSGDLAQAVLEGVAFALADGQEAMMRANTVINDVSVVGGGARSLYWGKILSSVLGRSLQYQTDAAVGAALGAAKLAWLAVNGGDPKEVLTKPALETAVYPDQKLHQSYQRKWRSFQTVYKNLEAIFKSYIQEGV